MIKKRFRVAKIISTLLFVMPFVRCVVLNGSLAQGKSNKNSDIDFLIICQSGRIFTARFLASSLVWLTGLKRSSSESKYHGGKICLNYYLTDEYLIIPHNRGDKMNKYCANNYSRSLLLAGDQLLFDKFMSLNMEWMEKYLISQKQKAKTKNQNTKIVSQNQEPKTNNLEIDRRDKQSMGFCNLKLKDLFEKRLSGWCGNRLELYLKKIQLVRINRDPRTKKYPNLIVVNDNEMRFHPPKNSNIDSRGT